MKSEWYKTSSGHLDFWWEFKEEHDSGFSPIVIAFKGERLLSDDQVFVLYETTAIDLLSTDLPVGTTFQIWNEWLPDWWEAKDWNNERAFFLERVSKDQIKVYFSVFRSTDDIEEYHDQFETEIKVMHSVTLDLFSQKLIEKPVISKERFSESLPRDWEIIPESQPNDEKQYEHTENDSPFSLPLHQPYETPSVYQWEPPENPTYYSVTFGQTYNISENKYQSVLDVIEEGKAIRDEAFTEFNRRMGRLGESSPPENEKQFTIRVVKPLLNNLGFKHVQYVHGPQEFGKDLVFSRVTEFGDIEWWAAQVKFGDISADSRKEDIDTMLRQIETAFGMPFHNLSSKKQEHISKVVVIISGAFTANATRQLIERLHNPAHRTNVIFIDGNRISELQKQIDLHLRLRKQELNRAFDFTL